MPSVASNATAGSRIYYLPPYLIEECVKRLTYKCRRKTSELLTNSQFGNNIEYEDNFG